MPAMRRVLGHIADHPLAQWVASLCFILLFIFGLASAGLIVESCASAPASIQTPAGRYAFKADQLVSALGIFQDAAIQANSQELVSDHDTALIVTAVKVSVQAVQAGATGWQAAVKSALGSAQTALSPAAQTKYAPYFSLLNTLVGSL